MREQSDGGGELVERRWKRYGHDRVYLEAGDGTKVGYVDLVKNELVVDCPEHREAAQRTFERLSKNGGAGQVDADASSVSKPPPIGGPSVRPRAPELPKLIQAKFDSTCTACGSSVQKGGELFWIPDTKVAVCPACTAAEVSAGLDAGTPGAAASRIATAGSRKHAEKILAAYPMLGEHLKANARPPSHVRSWIRGVDGERIVGRKLDIAAGKGRCVVLHDRRLPSGGNIDHIVIGVRRISVVDAKHYRNAKITKRHDELRINGEPAEDLIDGVKMQQFAVQDALAHRPIVADNVSAVLAFVGAKFGLTGIVTHRGVWCSSVKDAVDFVSHSGVMLRKDSIRLAEDEQMEIAHLLAAAFPAN